MQSVECRIHVGCYKIINGDQNLFAIGGALTKVAASFISVKPNYRQLVALQGEIVKVSARNRELTCQCDQLKDELVRGWFRRRNRVRPPASAQKQLPPPLGGFGGTSRLGKHPGPLPQERANRSNAAEANLRSGGYDYLRRSWQALRSRLRDFSDLASI